MASLYGFSRRLSHPGQMLLAGVCGRPQCILGQASSRLLHLIRHCSGISGWDRDRCMAWLTTVAKDAKLPIDVKTLSMDESLNGKTLLRSLGSTRELRDTFGLDTLDQRLAFEDAMKRANNFDFSAPSSSCGGSGAAFSLPFLELTRPLYHVRFGVENMAPFLYSLVRFCKPRRVLELGAGYTTMFILQALHDNYQEMKNHKMLVEVGECHVDGTPWSTPQRVLKPLDVYSVPYLVCVDNMAHGSTTAHKVLDAANQKGLSAYLKLKVDDAFSLQLDKEDTSIDMCWVDVGAGKRMGELFDQLWPHVNDKGGLILVHSSLTNTVMRSWTERMRQQAAEHCNPYGPFHMLSLLEPHKKFQNSVTLIQKRVEYVEPILTQHP